MVMFLIVVYMLKVIWDVTFWILFAILRLVVWVFLFFFNLAETAAAESLERKRNAQAQQDRDDFYSNRR